MEHDYRGLFIGDAPENIEPYLISLIKAGDQVTEQFTSACGTDISVVMLIVNMMKLEDKIARIKITVESLRTYWNDELVKDLRAMGIRNNVTPESLDAVLIEAKKFEIELKRTQDEYEKKSAGNGKEPSIEDKYKMFYKIIAEDGKYTVEDIDTMMFTVIYNKLKERAKQRKDGKQRTDR